MKTVLLAGALILMVSTNPILDNLFETYSPIQKEGDSDLLHLLPALPKAWRQGSVKGLRARGGFTVDMAWQDGGVSSYRLTRQPRVMVKVRINGKTKEAPVEKP